MRKCSWAFAGLLAWTLFTAAPAVPQTPSAEALTAAKELIVVMKMDEQYMAILPIAMQALRPAIVQGRAQIERDYDALLPAMLGVVQTRLDEITVAMATIYARKFTAAELREIAAFYRGPTGQKLLQNTSSLMQESMTYGQQLGAKMVEEIKERMIQELRKKGHPL